MCHVLQAAVPRPAPPPSPTHTKLMATEYFKPPTNSNEYDGEVIKLLEVM